MVMGQAQLVQMSLTDLAARLSPAHAQFVEMVVGLLQMAVYGQKWVCFHSFVPSPRLGSPAQPLLLTEHETESKELEKVCLENNA